MGSESKLSLGRRARCSVCGLLAALATQWAAAGAAPAVRLAVVPTDADVRAAADLLTVELSAHPQLALLERAEVERIQREQQLSASSATDNLKLGQMLGADGLLLLEQHAEGTNRLLVLRLIAVKPGVILRTTQYPWPVPDLGEWPKRVAQQLEPFFPKLGVLVKDALPVSILNLRSAVSSSEGRQAEKDLTLLLVNWLSREKEVFVLERQHLGMLSAEKELKGMDESAFWNGGYLLEGVVDRDGFSRERISVTVRLVPPNKVSQSFEVSGRRSDLPDVAQQLVRQVLQRIKNVPSNLVWDPAAEAARYFDEAGWAMRWRLYPQAQWAAESAWALGRHDLETACLRVQAYGGTVPGGSLSTRENSYHWIRSIVGPPCSTCLVPLVTAMDTYLGATPLLPAEAIRSPRGDPVRTELPRVSFRFASGAPLTVTKAPLGTWEQLGVGLLGLAADHLWCFAHTTEPQPEEESRRLREAARQIEYQLLGTNGLSLPNSKKKSVGIDILHLKLSFGWVWSASLEETIQEYRHLLAGGFSEDERRRFVFHDVGQRYLVAWTARDRERAPQLWESFCKELSASTNLSAAMEGRFLHHWNLVPAEMTTGPEGSYNQSIKALFDVAWPHREELVCQQPGLLLDALRIIDRAPIRIAGDIPTPGAIGHYGHFFRTNLFHYLATEARCFNREIVQGYFRPVDFDTNHLAAVLNTIVLRTGTEPGQVPQWRQQFYRALVRGREPHLPRDEDLAVHRLIFSSLFRAEDYEGEATSGVVTDLKRFRQSISADENFEQPLYKNLTPSFLAALKLTSARNRSFRDLIDSQLSALEARRPEPIPSPQAKPTSATLSATWAGQPLLVSHWWAEPTNRLAREETSDFVLLHALYREGRLWLETRMMLRQVVTNQDDTIGWQRVAWGSLFGVGLKDFSFSHHSFAPDNRSGPDPGAWSYLPRSFEVLGNQIYRVHDTKLLVASTTSRDWRELDVPVPGWSQLLALGGRLYLGSREALQEYDPASGKTRIMASVRRRPPVNDLDRLSSLGAPSLLRAGSNTLWFALRDTIWPWDIAQGAWGLPIPQRFPSMTAYPEQEQILFVRGNPQHEFAEVGRFTPGRLVEILFHVPAQFSSFARPPSSQPIWGGTGGQKPSLWPRVPEGPNLWSLDWSRPDSSPVLWYFDDRWEEPFAIPLAFNRTDPLPHGSGPMRRPEVELLAAPEGLILFLRLSSGFWFIPRTDLDAAIADRLRDRPRQPRVRQELKQVASTSPEVLETNRSIWADERGTNVARIMKVHDQDENRKLHYMELRSAVISEEALAGFRPGPGEGSTSLLLITPFDLDGDGMLDLSELKGMVQRGKPPMTYTELQQRYDKDGDGMVRRLEGGAAREALKPSTVEKPYVGLVINNPSVGTYSEGVSSRAPRSNPPPSSSSSPNTVRTNRLVPALKPYDLNGDGVLDERERAAMRKAFTK